MIKNREKLIETIKNDCSINGHYIFDGETCAVGGLAKAAGFDLTRFLTEPSPQFGYRWNELGIQHLGDWEGKTLGTEMIQAIAEEFGLTEDQLTEIQAMNDDPIFIEQRGGNSYQKTEERRAAILAYIESLK